MGNNASLPEKVFTAVQKNDVPGFQKLVATFGSPGQTGDPAARSRILEHKDKSGRTPLVVAASKNHYQILQQLISLGADIHYVNPSRDSLGTALHEAAAKRHEAAVDLLLAAGANPFAANASGRTALDEAVMSGHTGVVRAIEKRAEFSGRVAFKVRAMGGLSFKYKARWVVLMPYYPFQGSMTAGPTGRAGGDARKTRRCMWLYKDSASNSPRCRLWVDGATVLTHGPAGTEGTLRLHTSHGEPVGDLSTTYAKGYCVHMRPADLTPAAAATYQHLVSLLGAAPQPPTPERPPATPPSAGPAVAPGSAPAYPPQPPPPPPPPSPGAVPSPAGYPQVPPAAPMYGGPAGPGYVLVPPPVVTVHPAPPYPPYPPQPYMYPGAAGPSPMASPLSLFQEARRQVTASTAVVMEQVAAASATLQDHAAAAMAAVLAHAASDGQRPGQQQQQQQQQQQPRPQAGSTSAPSATAAAAKNDPPVGSGGAVIDGVFIERMAALPGESDEAFAARLASAISATSGQSQQHLYPRQSPSFSSASSQGQGQGQQRQSGSAAQTSITTTTTAAAAAPAAAGAGAGAGPWCDGASLINFQSDPGSHPASQDGGPAPGTPHQPRVPPAAAAAGCGPRGELDMAAVNALIGAQVGDRGGAARVPPSPPCATEKEAPSAPPAPDPAAAPPRPPPQPEAEADCVICLSAPKEVGFLHGNSVHRCVCRDCAAHVPVGAACPLCRQTVERVLGVY